MLDFTELPNFCSHEHWGSQYSIGTWPGGFRNDFFAGALPTRRTSVVDLLFEPYFHGWVSTGGIDVFDLVGEATGIGDLFQSAWDEPAATWGALRGVLRRHQLTGAFQCTRRGIAFAHGVDIQQLDDDEAAGLGRAIDAAYADLFTWYRRLMGRAHFTELIRPVHPEYYVQEADADQAALERSFTGTITRIDPFLELWPAQCERRDQLAGHVGIDPVDANSWRAFLDKWFDIFAAAHTTGIKQLQAYHRTLEYQVRPDASVKFRGDLSPGDILAFQDWVMHECFARAHDRGWPHQIHIGTHNLPESNPLPLARIARRYPHQALVLLHQHPYQRECGYLASVLPNVFLDTCWQPVLNPEFLRESFRLWLGYIPFHKIMLAHDATTIEMATGSSLFTREILAEALDVQGARTGASERELTSIAADMLHNNAVDLYGIGERVSI